MTHFEKSLFYSRGNHLEGILEKYQFEKRYTNPEKNMLL